MPDLHIKVENVIVTGMPHKTLAIVRWKGTAILENGDPYLNKGPHFITLKWGKVTELYVYEDKLAVCNGLQAAMLGALSTTELASAKLDGSFSDVVLHLQYLSEFPRYLGKTIKIPPFLIMVIDNCYIYIP